MVEVLVVYYTIKYYLSYISLHNAYLVYLFPTIYPLVSGLHLHLTRHTQHLNLILSHP